MYYYLEVERAMARSARLASWLDIGRLVFDSVRNQASLLACQAPSSQKNWETDQAKRLVFGSARRVSSSSQLVKPTLKH